MADYDKDNRSLTDRGVENSVEGKAKDAPAAQAQNKGQKK